MVLKKQTTSPRNATCLENSVTMSSTDFRFPGSVGLYLSLLFLATELLLLPLFEKARERLTTAYLRQNIANGNSIRLCHENKLSQWFGVSDGVYMPGRTLLIHRFLKMFFKIFLLLSCFLFDLYVEPAKVASKVTYSFNNGRSFVFSPLPVEGLSNDTLQKSYTMRGFSSKTGVPYQTRRVRGIEVNFLSECTSTRRGTNSTERLVHVGIYTELYKSLVCLNGSEGRDEATAFSYNPNSIQTYSFNISSIKLVRRVNALLLYSLYEAEVNLKGSSDYHRGLLRISEQPRLDGNNAWTMYGVLQHDKRATIMRLNIEILSLSSRLCGVEDYGNLSLLGLWTAHIYRHGQRFITCPRQNESYSILTPSRDGADVHDVNLRPGKSIVFNLGTSFEFMRAWMLNDAISVSRAPVEFTTELHQKISDDLFYLSGAKKDEIVFRIGALADHTTMKRFPTIALIVAVVTLLLYCIVSFIVEVRSRSVTGVSSNIHSREACLQMMYDKAVAHGAIQENKKIQLPVTLISSSAGKRLAVDYRHMTKNSLTTPS